MDKDTVAGILLVVCSLGFMIVLVLWSRGRIEKICRKKLRTARDIEKGLERD
jgi:hypothetical protein